MSEVRERGVCQRPEKLRGEPGECSPEQVRECHGTEGGHACLGGQEQQMLQEVKESMGFVPGPLVAMSKRPGTLSRFMAYGKGLMEDGPLSARERSLVALSAATALKSADCIRAHCMKARNAGATEEEVLQALLIAGMISNTSALHVAHESAGIFIGEPVRA